MLGAAVVTGDLVPAGSLRGFYEQIEQEKPFPSPGLLQVAVVIGNNLGAAMLGYHRDAECT